MKMVQIFIDYQQVVERGTTNASRARILCVYVCVIFFYFSHTYLFYIYILL